MNALNPIVPRDAIHLGDCMELLSGLPPESVDLVVSSPPYNLGKEYEAKRSLSIYLAEQREVLAECVRVMKPGASLFWQVGAFADSGELIPLDIRFFPILEDLGLSPRNRIVWIRQHGLHASKKYSCRHETILWFTKGSNYLFDLDAIRVPQKWQNKKHYRGEKAGELSCNPDGKNPGDIWLFRNVKHNHEEQTLHPCQFPEDMITRIVLSTTKKGGTVLDPYMGAGTVAVVARDTDRHYLGAETNPQYHSIAMRRLAGIPDENGSFPNLKSLRDYVERTGSPIEKFRFDAQVGKVATERSKSKIYGEEHHLEALETRLDYEETAFIAKLRGLAAPEAPDLNGRRKDGLSLADDA